ncbi:MAG: zinc ribbon domain-containing protein [Promethearchaeota archaeon]
MKIQEKQTPKEEFSEGGLKILTLNKYQITGLVVSVLVQNEEFEDRYYLLPFVFLQDPRIIPEELFNACNNYFLDLKENSDMIIEQISNPTSLLVYFEDRYNIKQKVFMQSLRELLKLNWHILEQIDFLHSEPRPITKGLSADNAGINIVIYRLKVGLEYEGFSRSEKNPYEHVTAFFQLNKIKSEEIVIIPSKKNRCNVCNSEIPSGSTFCPHCGTKSHSQVKIKTCFYCGKQNLPDSKFCSHCGRAHLLCTLCNQSIFGNQKYSTCKLCNTYFHWVHLLDYVRKQRVCPACLQPLTERDISKNI